MPVLTSEQKADFRRFEKNMKWFQSNYEKLRCEYAGEYVAVNRDRIAAHDKDARALIKRLREQYEDIGVFVIEFVSEDKMELIL